MRERLEIDPTHTQIGFSARHLGVSTVRGHFGRFSGAFEIDTENLAEATGEVTVDAASIYTGTEQRDGHLRSADFFDVEKYPTITFRLTSVEPRSGDQYLLTGDLTIKETTRPITLNLVVEGEAPDFTGGGKRIGVTASGQLDRMDYGLNWDGLAGAIPLASHTIKLSLEAELIANPVVAEEAAGTRV
jgi:polyisoprenoid-binding protein YceI